MADEQKIVQVAVRVYIFNKKGELFLIQNPKENSLFTIPGGHIEFREKIEDAATREVKEETGLDILNLRFLTLTEYFSDNGKEHYITIRYTADVADDNQEPVLSPDEATDGIWINPVDALARADVKETVKKHIKNFFLNAPNSKLEKECAEYKLGWQRAVADYQNLQKETRERRQEWVEMSELQILEEFIPVYEHLKLAINNEQLANSKDPWLVGVKHVAKQFDIILKAHKIEAIKTVGEKFDPKFHEAAGEAHEPEPRGGSVQGLVEPGTIVREVAGGYMMNGRVIKAAKVIISK